MEENENKNLSCPVGKTLRVLGGKWRLRIINEIGADRKRFGELKRLIPDVSEKMLIQELKNLVQHGILVRKAYNEIPPRVEYFLSDKGKRVLPIIDEIKKFAFESELESEG